MDQQVIEIENLPAGTVVAAFRGVIAEILLRNDDVMPVLFAVGKLVDGVTDGVCFDDQKSGE